MLLRHKDPRRAMTSYLLRTKRGSLDQGPHVTRAAACCPARDPPYLNHRVA